MKFLVLLLLLIHSLNSFSQTKKKSSVPKQTVIVRDQNNVQGNQTVNYNTIVKKKTVIIKHNSKTKREVLEAAINATKGSFSSKPDCTGDYPTIRLGSNIYQGIGQMAAREFVQQDYQPLPIFFASCKNKHIEILAIIRDSKGDEVAKLSGRTWEITNSASIEYNNDSTAFEIRTGRRVVFQIELKQDTIICNGMFVAEQGDAEYITPQGSMTIAKNPSWEQRFVLPEGFMLLPLFAYPRKEHLGSVLKGA